MLKKSMTYLGCLTAFLLILTIPAYGQAEAIQGIEIEKRTYAYVERDSTLYLDLYQKKGETEVRPCVIFIFGGGFATGNRDARAYQPYFQTLVNQGLKVVSIDYRLGLAGIYDEVGIFNTKPLGKAIDMAVADLFQATAYLIAKSDELHIDPSGIIVSGSSAGAITSLHADWYLKNNHELSQVLPEYFRYSGVISFAGAIFSTSGKPTYKSPPSPTLFFHGTKDKTVPYSKRRLLNKGFFGSAFLADQFVKNGYPFYFVSEKEATHQVAVSAMHEGLGEVLQFIGTAVNSKAKFQKETTLIPLKD
jgi:dipeptidyl aminopeptidase/acylaminoacyl peptidase